MSPPLESDAFCMVSVVVPTYREAENLPELVRRVHAAFSDSRRAYELVIVDDDSGDGTERVADGLTAEGYPLRLITRVGERGLSSAVIRGFREAKGDVLLCMDADLSHPPEAIPVLVDTLEREGADFVIGSRYVPGGETEEDWGFLRWLNSKVATLLARPFTSARDPMAGFFALRRDAFERAAPLNPVGYKIGLELIVKCGCRDIREVAIRFANRKRGESKLSLKEQMNYLKHLKRLADFKFRGFSQFVQFCAVGASGMVIDLGSYAAMLGAQVPTMAGRALAIWLAMTWNFVLNRWITFNAAGTEGVIGQYGRFVASCSVGALINLGLSVGLLYVVPQFRFVELACAIVGIAAATLSNFLLSRYWVFRSYAVFAPAAGANTRPEPEGGGERS